MKVTPSQAENIKRFFCPPCREKDDLNIVYRKNRHSENETRKATNSDGSSSTGPSKSSFSLEDGVVEKKPKIEGKQEGISMNNDDAERCNQCIGCFRTDDCGKCDYCKVCMHVYI